MKYDPTTPPWAGPGPGPQGGVLSGRISSLFLCFSMILGSGLANPYVDQQIWTLGLGSLGAPNGYPVHGTLYLAPGAW